MATPYIKQTWVDGPGGGTPISAARLGVIEQGIYDSQTPTPGYIYLEDEFMNNQTTEGQMGQLGWSKVNTAQGSATYDPGITDHAGLQNLNASGTTGNIFGICSTASPASNGFILPAQIDRIIWICKPVATSSALHRVGLCTDPSVNNGGTDGVWWEANGTTWRSVSRGASTNTNNNSITATAGNWYKAEIRRTAGGDYEFWMNDTLRFTHTTNKPGANALIPFAVVETSAAAAKQLVVDYFGFLSVALGQRWT